MKKFKLAGFVFPLTFAINQAMCVGFIEYSDIGVEDPPESRHARPNSISIKDIVNEHELLEEEHSIKGMNRTKLTQHVVWVMTNKYQKLKWCEEVG